MLLIQLRLFQGFNLISRFTHLSEKNIVFKRHDRHVNSIDKIISFILYLFTSKLIRVTSVLQLTSGGKHGGKIGRGCFSHNTHTNKHRESTAKVACFPLRAQTRSSVAKPTDRRSLPPSRTRTNANALIEAVCPKTANACQY